MLSSQKGEASADTLALINALFMLVDIVVAVFPREDHAEDLA